MFRLTLASLKNGRDLLEVWRSRGSAHPWPCVHTVCSATPGPAIAVRLGSPLSTALPTAAGASCGFLFPSGKIKPVGLLHAPRTQSPSAACPHPLGGFAESQCPGCTPCHWVFCESGLSSVKPQGPSGGSNQSGEARPHRGSKIVSRRSCYPAPIPFSSLLNTAVRVALWEYNPARVDCAPTPVTPRCALNLFSAVVSFSLYQGCSSARMLIPQTPAQSLPHLHEVVKLTSLGCTLWTPQCLLWPAPSPRSKPSDIPYPAPLFFPWAAASCNTLHSLFLVFLLLFVVAYCFVFLCWEVNSLRSRAFFCSLIPRVRRQCVAHSRALTQQCINMFVCYPNVTDWRPFNLHLHNRSPATGIRFCKNPPLSSVLTYIVRWRTRGSMHAQSCPTLCDPWTVARLLCPWNSPGKKTGVGCHLQLQGIFLTQGLNPDLLGLLHWQADSLPPRHQWSRLRVVGRDAGWMWAEFSSGDAWRKWILSKMTAFEGTLIIWF